MFFLFLLDLFLDGGDGLIFGLGDEALDRPDQPDEDEHGRCDGKEHHQQQEEGGVVLGEARGVFPRRDNSVRRS